MKFHIAMVLLGIATWSGGLQGVIDREEVADKIFPRLAVTSEGPSYLTRMILRFSDPDSEIVIKTRLDGGRVVESYILDPGVTIDVSVSQMLQKNPEASLDQLASGIRVHRAAISVPQAHIAQWVREISEIIPGKLPSTQIHLDKVPQFDLWIDANGDFVHYRFYDVPEQQHTSGSPLASLARWMLKLNAEVANFRREGTR